MYTINQNTEKNTLEVTNTENTVFGKIYLNKGASLQELTLGGNAIIQDLNPLTYDSTFASSILFPFANRIKDGKYSFNNEDFQLEKNQEEEQNALHGFVYNKTFKVIDKKVSADTAKITLEYIEKTRNAGFPYTYAIQVTYTFTNDGLDLTLAVKNTDTKVFPFTLGWHPYFISDNLAESSLNFDCDQKLIIGDRNITTGSEDVKSMINLAIENKQLDDCWGLNSDKVTFKTPKYQLNFQSSGKDIYLQTYTPPRLNTIAIEPTTGVSNSFNNKIGLQTLKPHEKYSIVWKINIINN
ncbi:aldose 1-epimerase [Polaribacter sp. Z014]|uniref:aldose 1-epimerase n=1 Tax=unclassified Polaribacter TaxID=196858 RepID=UPI00193B289A|nr:MULTISPECIES: aldose 1-epimerase [unclassified Polaribacter]MCL7764755.1 aldose 1-epimerase [Polaribacter sp. Z014]QVY64054.1 aldose 1-epimerase [Polaribacter sp. Q13]